MKPRRFEYLAPDSLPEALVLRARYGSDASVLAGGQSLIPLLNLRMASPSVIIDLGRVVELARIRELDSGVAIGAMTRQRTVERSRLIAERCPLVVRALGHVGCVTIRNRGTLGGSVALADRAAELPAVALALDAELLARSVRGERLIPAAEFFAGHRTTALAPDELLVEIRIPSQAPGSGSAFVEVAYPHGHAALAGAAAIVRREHRLIVDARLVLIADAGGAVRSRTAESALAGAYAKAAAYHAAAVDAAAALAPISDIHGAAHYRRRIAAVVARRALAEAAG